MTWLNAEGVVSEEKEFQHQTFEFINYKDRSFFKTEGKSASFDASEVDEVPNFAQVAMENGVSSFVLNLFQL